MAGRFTEPLTSKGRLSFPAPDGMAKCVDEMASTRGVGRAEMLRRIVAAAIVEDAPVALPKLARRHREAIEGLGTLAVN